MNEGHSISIFSQIIFPLVNFFIFIGILFYILKKPLKSFLKERSLHVEKTIQEAQISFENVHEQYERTKQKLDHFEEEKKHLLQNTEKDIVQLKEKTEATLKQLIETMQQEHEQRLEEEVRKAAAALRRSATKNIIEASQKMIQKNLKSKGQERLAEEYLETISQDELKAQKEGLWQSGSQSATPKHS